MNKSSLPTKAQANQYLHKGLKYIPVVFIIFLVGLYGFLALRIMNLTNAEADSAAVSSQLQTIGVPKVDEEVVNKMLRLQDNSVSVKTLFEEARSNPFGE